VIEKEESNFDCQSKPALIFRAFVVTDDLNPRIMNARFLDCGPNLFFVTVIGGSGRVDASMIVETRGSVETRLIASLLLALHSTIGIASLPLALRLYRWHCVSTVGIASLPLALHSTIGITSLQ